MTRVFSMLRASTLQVPGAKDQKLLEEALSIMTREDPSLHVTANEDTGQLLLSGMGELHLDIACDRLQREHDVPVTMGRMQVSYRETVLGHGEGEVGVRGVKVHVCIVFIIGIDNPTIICMHMHAHVHLNTCTPVH